MSEPGDAALARARDVVAGARAALEANVGRINDLNVYPVPDGDTGTNLAHTVQAVSEALERQEPAPAAALARAVSRAALMGARGNSGIILSQVVRGLCERLGEERPVDAAVAAAALRSASDAAYRAVRQPVEGTMLTVVREMAGGAEAALAAAPAATLEDVLAAALEAGERALERTPELLEVLRQAGVVDAGGAGLVELLRGALARLRGEPAAAGVPHVALRPAPVADGHEDSRYRYCTNFLVEGPDVDAGALEAQLALLGDSLVVVRDGETSKVHLHTDDPGAALTAATAMGPIEGVEIANMQQQARERSARLAARPALRAVPSDDRRTDVVAVVAGAGNRVLFESEGARALVEGGQSMNPSTQELLEAIGRCGAPEVIVLPNNPNVILAAEQAALAAERPVLVVPSRSLSAGLAAMVAYDRTRTAEENARRMRTALDQVRTGAVTTAVRDATANGVQVRKGDYLTLLEGQIVGSHDRLAAALREAAERLLADGGEVLTVLRGRPEELNGNDLDGALAALAAAHPGVDIEIHDGGQPHYPVLLSAE